MISTVLERLAHRARLDLVRAGSSYSMTGDDWYLFAAGTATAEDCEVLVGDEFGCRPFTTAKFGMLQARTDCRIIRLHSDDAVTFLRDIPQFSYLLRRYRVESRGFRADWLRGAVTTW